MVSEARQRATIPPAALFAAAAGAQQLLESRRPASVWRLGSGMLVVAAAWFGFGSVIAFRKQGTTVTPVHVENASSLVTSGPNRLSRNPMYVALLLMLVANAIHKGRFAGLIPAAGFAAMIDRLQIPKEEVALVETFGKEYEAYRTSTPRWLWK